MWFSIKKRLALTRAVSDTDSNMSLRAYLKKTPQCPYDRLLLHFTVILSAGRALKNNIRHGGVISVYVIIKRFRIA